MSRLIIGMILGGLGLAVSSALADNPYLEPLKPKTFTAGAVVLPAREIGTMTFREKRTLAVEIQVQLEDFLPRNMEPTLLINGVPVEGGTRVVRVEDRVTTIGFMVEQPQLLTEGAVLSVRMEDVPGTQAKVPGELRQANIKGLSTDLMKERDLPSLAEWLQQRK